MSMIQQGIAYMAEIFEMYFQNVGYIILVCAVILLLLTRYRKKEVTHLLFVCGIILILFLNPVVIYLVCSLKGAVTGRYVRIFWLFPFTIGIAYVGAQLLDKRKLWVRAIMIAAIVVILWGTGGPVLKKYIAPSNYYKMDSEIIEIADKIETYEDAPYTLATVYVSTNIRQYDANIRLVFGRENINPEVQDLYDMLYSTAAGYFSYDELYYIGIRSAEIGVNTIVLAKHQVQCTALETLGYERVDETEEYYIFDKRQM